MPDTRRWTAPAWPLAVLSTLLLALAVLWIAARARVTEVPRWSDEEFASLHEAPGAPDGWAERWVVAVEPDCPHCRVSLESVAAARDHSGAAVDVTALIVDAARAPADSTLAMLPADESRWDSGGRWRRSWGHAIYGEVLCFDPAGRLLRVLPPFRDASEARRQLSSLGLDAFPE